MQTESPKATSNRSLNPNVSIILPCFNASHIILDTLTRLTEFCVLHADELGSSEMIIVDDGSSDDTVSRVREQFPDMSLITLPRNQGKGAAVREGMQHATGRYRFFMDADMPYDLAAMLTMLRYLDFKEFDVVIGARDSRQAEQLVKRSAMRRWSSAVFTEVISRLVVTGVKDTQCGFKGFRREAADYLFGTSKVNRFAFDVEVLYLAYKNDLDVKRVPVTLVTEDYSTVSVIRDGTRMLLDTILLPVRYYSGKYPMMGR